MTTFISYSKVNSDFAVNIAKDLRSAGFDIWLDQLDIPTGSRWDDELEKALDRCSTFLIVLSPESIKSQHVKDEIGYANDAGKHILPVLIKNCKIPLRLRRFQFVDFTDDSYRESLNQIKQMLSNTSMLQKGDKASDEIEDEEIQFDRKFKSITTTFKENWSKIKHLLGNTNGLLPVNDSAYEVEEKNAQLDRKYKNEATTTYISYSRVNSDFAIKIAKDLRSAGFDIWLDQLDIPTGSRWDDELEKALDRCKTFLIVLSPESIKSQNVKDEIGYAIDAGKDILPVLINNCKIPLRLRRFQFVDFTDDSYRESLDQIKQMLGQPSKLIAGNHSADEVVKKEIQPLQPHVGRINQIPETNLPLKVFLCHAHADRDVVRRLYTRLTKDGIDAWLDREKLLPGQDWELEIGKAVRESDVVIVCQSKHFSQAGFRQKEVRLALDTAAEKPEGSTFILPVRLEESEPLSILGKWHWVDYFLSDGYKKVMQALQIRAELIGAVIKRQKEPVLRHTMLSQRAKKKKRGKLEISMPLNISEIEHSSGVEKKRNQYKPPKVFISYAWEDDVKKWTRELASRLRADGIETILDQWSAVPGDQLPQLMEKSVKTSDFVLAICTPKYRRRCNGRHGGVGYEGDVITNELLTNHNQRKFIPILCKGKWKSSAPSWASGKFYLNLTDENEYADDDYKALLRTLHGKSQNPPPIGNVPNDL